MDFTAEDSKMLRTMLENRFPDHVIMEEWRNQISQKLRENLQNEGFDDEQIRKVNRVVWIAFDL